MTNCCRLGLEKVHQLTNQHPKLRTTLRIELLDQFGSWTKVEYDGVSVSKEGENYFLAYGYMTGGGEDGLGPDHRNVAFSTRDRDNDQLESINCAEQYGSGWWHNDCYKSNLNAPEIHWNGKKGYVQSRMSIITDFQYVDAELWGDGGY